MTPARLRTIEEIFSSALTRAPDQIDGFLETACQGDESLRGKVKALLAAYEPAHDFIQTPAVALAAKILGTAPTDSRVGLRMGHYQLCERIGIGGMGEVYLATDMTAGRKAALKLLPTRFTGDGERLKRFEQEARAVVGLNHPNILTVYEIGEDHSTHYIASELIDGETLRQNLGRGPMEVNEALEVAIQVASALQAAHNAGIIHRDIKPENIMLRPDGYVKVLDFGIAKLAEQEVPLSIAPEEALLLVETNLGSILGTVRYMSPEQARGASVDQRTDIWSLGTVLYEMVTGRAPFTGGTPREVMNSIRATEPPPLTNYLAQTSGELQQIISRTLRKEREARYQSAHELLEALKSLRRGMELKDELARSPATLSWRSWIRSPATLVLAAVVAALAMAIPFYWHRNPPASSIPEKSIAVLPFENLSDNKENSYFAAGIQDDLLTSLAQIHELKVISRTSVMAYQKADGHNLREIAQALGVANVLEGSVRREGKHILVSVQLIDARNDLHLWAERYDRTIADSIGLQGELAREIATALKAQLAPQEKISLETKLTDDPKAYALYLQARGREVTGRNSGEDDSATEQLYARAIALDPKFALAYARRSIINSRLARRAEARREAEEALRLAPSLGEAHTAIGLSLYWGDKDYTAALKEFSIAAVISPNKPEIFTYIAGIYRRQGRWRDSLATFQRAQELDPRNSEALCLAANNHLYLRDWSPARTGFRRMLKVEPGSARARIGPAYIEVFQNSSPAAGRKILQSIPAGVDPNGMVTEARWDLAMLERDYPAAEKILADDVEEKLCEYPKPFYQGRTALARGDIASARRYFNAAIPVFEGRVHADPADPEHHAKLGLLYAYLHRSEDAIRESRRAVELDPESQDAFHGALAAANLAQVYALIGEQEQAIALIERLLSIPGPVSWPDCPSSMTLADLRLRWEWDSLRSNPRFQKILQGPEPKTVF